MDGVKESQKFQVPSLLSYFVHRIAKTFTDYHSRVNQQLRTELKISFSRFLFYLRNKYVHYGRWFVALMAVVVISLQIHELNHKDLHGFLLYGEIIFSIILLISIHLVIEILMKSVAAETRSVYILNQKQRFSQELISIQEWTQLTDVILQNFVSIVQPEYACLFIHNQDNASLELVLDWKLVSSENPVVSVSPVLHQCKECALKQPNVLHDMQACKMDNCPNRNSFRNSYCVPLFYGNDFIGLLYFNKLITEPITQDQIEVINGIGIQKAAALCNAQHSKQHLEIKIAEAALAERVAFTQDLHDSLAQNISYLHLKLEQLLDESVSQGNQYQQIELRKMLEVADEAYTSVRTQLKSLRATKSLLTNLILEQFKKVSSKTNMICRFNEEGYPRELSAEVLRQMYFIVQEALNNIITHACARTIEALVVWAEDKVMIRIKDDGKGFDQGFVPQDGHFGLSIMRERVESIKGSIELITRPGTGTELTVHIPIT